MRYRPRGFAAVVSDDRHEFYVRQWLNDRRHGGPGFIHTSIPRDPDRHLTDFELEISDCYRRIDLYFEVDSPHDRRNSLAKLDILIEVTTRFRDLALQKAVEEIQHRRRERRARKAEEEAPGRTPAPASAPA